MNFLAALSLVLNEVSGSMKHWNEVSDIINQFEIAFLRKLSTLCEITSLKKVSVLEFCRLPSKCPEIYFIKLCGHRALDTLAKLHLSGYRYVYDLLVNFRYWRVKLIILQKVLCKCDFLWVMQNVLQCFKWKRFLSSNRTRLGNHSLYLNSSMSGVHKVIDT